MSGNNSDGGPPANIPTEIVSVPCAVNDGGLELHALIINIRGRMIATNVAGIKLL
jgi:hypothetical protein